MQVHCRFVEVETVYEPPQRGFLNSVLLQKSPSDADVAGLKINADADVRLLCDALDLSCVGWCLSVGEKMAITRALAADVDIDCPYFWDRLPPR